MLSMKLLPLIRLFIPVNRKLFASPVVLPIRPPASIPGMNPNAFVASAAQKPVYEEITPITAPTPKYPNAPQKLCISFKWLRTLIVPPIKAPAIAPIAAENSPKKLPSGSTYIIGAFPQNRYGLAICAAGSTLNHRPKIGS